ncbi:UDP-3-O-(3-hydroxymyristoyl)glucosamine N-acyltransferase [Gemmatimonadota bacterium]
MKNTNEAPQADRSLTAMEVAQLVGGRLEGNPDIRVRGIAPLDQATGEELGFLAQGRYLRHLDTTQAESVLVGEALAHRAEGVAARVVVPDAYAALARLLQHFFPLDAPPPGVHPTAVLGPGVELGTGITVGPYAVLDEGVVVGDRVRIGSHSFVGARCRIGNDSILFSHVVLYPETRLGARVILHSGVCLGVDGFGYVSVEGKHRKVPQVGACVVEDDVEIGANTCVDGGSIGRTIIGKGSKLDNLVHLGHNVQIGQGVLMAAMVGIAGSTRIGDGAILGGQAGLVGHIEVGEGARIGAQAGVIGDIPAGETVSGFPARNNREYLRAMGMAFRLPETQKRLETLEKRLQALEGRAGDDEVPSG